MRNLWWNLRFVRLRLAQAETRQQAETQQQRLVFEVSCGNLLEGYNFYFFSRGFCLVLLEPSASRLPVRYKTRRKMNPDNGILEDFSHHYYCFT